MLTKVRYFAFQQSHNGSQRRDRGNPRRAKLRKTGVRRDRFRVWAKGTMERAPSGSAPAALGGRPERDAVAQYAAQGDAYPPLSLPEMFSTSAATDPSAPLVEFLGRSFSYGQIAAQARSIAAGLQAINIGKGDRVGLFLPNVPLYLSA